MRLEIVSHCYHYSRLLTYQLSSLALHPVRSLDVRMTVFWTREDAETERVLEYFAPRLPKSIEPHWWELPKEQLFRRAIGRNLAALGTSADWVWFCDCDLVFGEGSLDALEAALRTETGPLVYPRRVWISASHGVGDKAIARVTQPCVIAVEPTEFVERHYSRAIGGVQIVPGDIARQKGYLGHVRRYQRPADRFQPMTEDVRYRKVLGTAGEPIHVPNLFRINHSERGVLNPDLRL